MVKYNPFKIHNFILTYFTNTLVKLSNITMAFLYSLNFLNITHLVILKPDLSLESQVEQSPRRSAFKLDLRK